MNVRDQTLRSLVNYASAETVIICGIAIPRPPYISSEHWLQCWGVPEGPQDYTLPANKREGWKA